MEEKSKSEINRKYVLVLWEDVNRHLFTIKEHIVDSSDVVVSEIMEIVENPRKSLRDLYSQIRCYLDRNTNYQLCFPYEYNSSFIEPAYCPEEIPSDTPNYGFVGFNSDIERGRKKKYATQVIRYIRCKKLCQAFAEVKDDSQIKMYSSDSIGWTTFKYSISDDIHVMVKTNFAYGSSSYFYLAVKYKDMVLIPYSDLVHYYYANMKDFISYTRSYACKRDSWRYALKYVADFVNASRNSPEEFIRTYVLSEVMDMMKGLRATIDRPKEVLEKVKDYRTSYFSMKVIRPFYPEDQCVYEMLPIESVAVFKAEKVSGALMFLDSLDYIKFLCPEVREMNVGIRTEVEAIINRITNDLIPLEKEQKENKRQFDKIEKRILPYDKILYRLIQNTKLTGKEVKDNYMAKHPNYVKLLKERDVMQSRISDLNTIILRRKTLLNRMNVCLNRINEKC